jgi:putative NAD(P)-binding protein
MILVTGATGRTGGALVRRLSAEGIPVRALVRSAARAEGLSALPAVEIVEGDMAHPATHSEALRDVDRAMLISSSDPTMLEVQSNFIDAAAAAGIEHVVKLSGIMPDLDSPFRFARMHGEIERRLEASGMAFTHLRAGEFMHAYFRQVPSIVAQGRLLLPWRGAVALAATGWSSETGRRRTRRPRPAPVPRSAFAGFRFPPDVIVLCRFFEQAIGTAKVTPLRWSPTRQRPTQSCSRSYCRHPGIEPSSMPTTELKPTMGG